VFSFNDSPKIHNVLFYFMALKFSTSLDWGEFVKMMVVSYCDSFEGTRCMFDFLAIKIVRTIVEKVVKKIIFDYRRNYWTELRHIFKTFVALSNIVQPDNQSWCPLQCRIRFRNTPPIWYKTTQMWYRDHSTTVLWPFKYGIFTILTSNFSKGIKYY